MRRKDATNSDNVCAQCKDKIASIYCKQCDVFLCQLCSAARHSDTRNGKHELRQLWSPGKEKKLHKSRNNLLQNL